MSLVVDVPFHQIIAEHTTQISTSNKTIRYKLCMMSESGLTLAFKLPEKHRPSLKPLWYWPFPSSCCHALFFFIFISCSVLLPQVMKGLPLVLLPWWVHIRACSVIDWFCLVCVWPIHFHIRLLIWFFYCCLFREVPQVGL